MASGDDTLGAWIAMAGLKLLALTGVAGAMLAAIWLGNWCTFGNELECTSGGCGGTVIKSADVAGRIMVWPFMFTGDEDMEAAACCSC